MKSCQASHVRIDLLWLQDANHGEQLEFFFTFQKKSFSKPEAAMSFKRVTLKHELSSTIEHSLEGDSNFLEITRKANSFITYGPDKAPETSTEFEVTLKVNEKTSSQCYKHFTGLYLQVCKHRAIVKITCSNK